MHLQAMTVHQNHWLNSYTPRQATQLLHMGSSSKDLSGASKKLQEICLGSAKCEQNNMRTRLDLEDQTMSALV